MGRRRLHLPASVGMTAARVGEPRRQGRFLRPSTEFTLASGLRKPGAMGIKAAVLKVEQEWSRQCRLGLISESTVYQHKLMLRSLESFLLASRLRLVSSITNGVLCDWLYSPTIGGYPTSTMLKQRRAVVSVFYLTLAVLGITDNNLAPALPSFSQQPRERRPCSAAEVALLKNAAPHRQDAHASAGSTKGPVALALLLIGAQTSEAPHIRVRDIDLLNQRVWVHGNVDRYRPRFVTIDDSWVYGALMDRVAFLVNLFGSAAADMTVAYDKAIPRKSGTVKNSSAAIANTIAAIAEAANLHTGDKPVRAGSILEYVAQREFDATGRIESVALRLGMSSLDRASDLIGYDWREGFGSDDFGGAS